MYMKNNKKRLPLPSIINEERSHPFPFYFLIHEEFTNQQKYV